MLELTRRPDESLRLYTSDGVIEITVHKIKGQQVRIGIDAPRNVNIVRREIDQALHLLPVANQ